MIHGNGFWKHDPRFPSIALVKCESRLRRRGGLSVDIGRGAPDLESVNYRDPTLAV